MDLHRENVQKARRFCQEINNEIGKVIVGFDNELQYLNIALLCGGHILLEGAPGLAKTLFVRSFAKIAGLSFKRIQFTPDLMPSDVTGSMIYNEEKHQFQFIEGPIFANIVLADEINRTPPKTQSALLESMQESSVTVAQSTYSLPKPFFVFATQNPIEQEGTYPLPEAQLDRFLFKIPLQYPTQENEIKIASMMSEPNTDELKVVKGIESLQEMQFAMKHILCSEQVIESVVKLVSATRPESEHAPDFIKKYIQWGAGPRASRGLLNAAKVKAALDGRYHIEKEDISFTAPVILKHRILLNYHAIADNENETSLVNRLIEEFVS